jgi:hypothetical protein
MASQGEEENSTTSNLESFFTDFLPLTLVSSLLSEVRDGQTQSLQGNVPITFLSPSFMCISFLFL